MELAILIVSVFTGIVVGVFTFNHKPNSYTHRFFLALTFSSAAWGIANYSSLHQISSTETLDSIRWVMFFAVLYALFLFFTVHTFPQNRILLKKSLLTFLIVWSAIVLFLTRTSLIFSSIRGIGKDATPVPGPAITIFAVTTGLLVLSSMYLLVKRYRVSRGMQRAQLQYLIVGVIGSAFLTFMTNFVLVVAFNNMSLLFLGPTYTLIFTAATAYAIVAHRLFDIRIIIRRTVVYSGLLLFTLGTYSMVVFFFTTIFGSGTVLDAKTFVANMVAALFIALGFEPLRRWLTTVTDKYLFKGEYEPQAVLAKLSQQLAGSSDLAQVMQSLITLIKAELRLSHAGVITFNQTEKGIEIKQVFQIGYADPSILQLPSGSSLLESFVENPQILIADEMRHEYDGKSDAKGRAVSTLHSLLKNIDDLKIAIALPIKIGAKTIGVFMVGEKLSGDAFSSNEVEFLTIVANQTANAIEKARFWEEDQMKSEFVSIASHELLTPTAAIKGYLSMILDDDMGKVDTKARQFLVKVSTSADRLANLVEDLLNVSRIESGRLKVIKREFSFADLVSRATEELQVNAKKKSLDLSFVAPAKSLPNAFGDPNHIYRVLINFIGNSIKYTSKGWVKCYVAETDNKQLMFKVADSGVGIPKDMINHLFVKFNRADRKDIAGIQGTGLGLYISKKIIELMGGQVAVESEVGKGSTFTFTVPMTTPELIASNPPPPPLPQPGPTSIPSAALTSGLKVPPAEQGHSEKKAHPSPRGLT